MRILDESIWYAGLAFEALLLARGVYTKLFSTYFVFYSYIAFVFSQSLLRLIVYHYISSLYAYLYWTTEFLGVAFGCGVVFEIYRIGLGPYPGTARMARRLLMLVFMAAIIKGLADASIGSRWWAEATTIDIERALRTVQALAIAALVALFLSYRITVGRNLGGILVGYGLFVTSNVLWFTFAKSGGDKFRDFWSYFNPASYDVALGIWVVYLWCRATENDAAPNVRLDEQYRRVAERTRRGFREARGYLGKMVGP